MSIKSLVKQVLTKKENRRYEKLLRERCVTYAEWAAWQESQRKLPQDTQRKPLKEARHSGEFVVICAGKGVLAVEAMEDVRACFAEHFHVELLYGDEDVWEGNDTSARQSAASGRCTPWFKPDWSPDLLDSYFYFGSVVAMRKELFQRTMGVYESACRNAGDKEIQILCLRGENAAEGVDFYEVADLAAYEKWIHICVGLAGGYQKQSRAVGHIPEMLFHCESEAEQEKFMQDSLFLKECRAELLREFRDSRAATENEDKAVISVIIPSKDNPDILEKCVKGCILAAGTKGDMSKAEITFEIIVVDNGSSQENRRRIDGMVQRLTAEGCRITYLYQPMEFNFSKMCNLGAAGAKGEFLLFLNDDVELCQQGCMGEMAALAGRDHTGAVGMKLYYPDSVRIQHAGITNLPMGPVHKLQFLEDNKCYYYKANQGRRNFLAVTAACLMVEKDKYLEAGGFSEELRVAFNDVDFCFRLYELGYANVCMNDLYAYHHESLSRGADESTEKLERLLEERAKLYARHPGLEGMDPYYPEGLNRYGLDTRIRPACETAGNRPQQVRNSLKEIGLEGFRQDECLMVRIEDLRNREAVGYGVVLGDNNACYDKELLLCKEQENASSVHSVKVEGQYRPDLEENMPDQENVALSGFDVKIGETAIPKGRYRLGMAARNRVTGLRLVNWSNRFIEL